MIVPSHKPNSPDAKTLEKGFEIDEDQRFGKNGAWSRQSGTERPEPTDVELLGPDSKTEEIPHRTDSTVNTQ